MRLARVSPSNAGTPGNLLCVSNFPSNTGFAWDFIEGLYAGLSDQLTKYGIRTFVAYPSVDEPPKPLAGSRAEAIEQEIDLGDPRSCVQFVRLVRKLDIGAVYLSDRPVWHPAYAVIRLAGVHRVIVHDHTSGQRTPPTGWKRNLKRMRSRIPGTLADRVLAVSDFVARRKANVDLVPPEQITRIWNSVVIPESTKGRSCLDLRARFELPPGAAVIACASRASPVKGIDHLFRAFDRLLARWDPGRRGQAPFLVFMGDGPALGALQDLRDRLPHGSRILTPGYVEGAGELIGTADVAVVPSLWQEAFGLTALEPMSWGVPVVASNVGGIPEVVRDGEEGLLVPPGDEEALSEAILRLLDGVEERRTMGCRGRERSRQLFSRKRQLEELVAVFEEELGLTGEDET